MEEINSHILKGLVPFEEFMTKYSYGRAMSIVGIAIIVLTIVVPFLPFLQVVVDYETKILFIVTGLILLMFGGVFLFVDKFLITKFKQKCAFLLIESAKNDKELLRGILGSMLTEDQKTSLNN